MTALRSFFGLLVLGVLLIASSPAQAQSSPDYKTWNSLSDSFQTVAADPKASESRLEALRESIVRWRQSFQQAQGLNAAEIATVEGQLSTLGPAPEQGATEDETIAARRNELESELAALKAPVTRAEEAYTEATGLIGQIDASLRARTAKQLLSRTDAPVFPTHWGAALQSLSDGGARVVSHNPPRPIPPLSVAKTIGVAAIMAMIGALLFAFGGRLIGHVGQWAQSRWHPESGVWSFAVSGVQLLIATFGLFLLSVAVIVPGWLSPEAEDLVSNLPFYWLLIASLRWLVTRIFPDQALPTLVPLVPTAQVKMKRLIFWLSVIICLWSVLDLVIPISESTPDVLAVLRSPVFLLVAVVLYRIGVLLRLVDRPPQKAGEEAAPPGLLVRFLPSLSFLLRAVAVIGPILAFSGYVNAAQASLFPAAYTVILLGALLVLQDVIFDLYGMVTGRFAHRHEALVPTLSGFVLVLLALPLLALIWGARLTDLTELWQRFLSGFSLGETRISPSVFLTFAIVFALGYLATRLVQNALKSTVLPKTRIDSGAQNALVSGIGYLGIFLAALVAITSAGINLSSLAIVAGALSVGIGFGLQNVVSNFVSGIILLIERPIAEGDWIEVGPNMGTVKDISVRSTRIQTFDRTDVIVPNADLVSGVVTNWTRGNLAGRLILPVGVAYGTDTRKVEQILREIAEAEPMVLANPAPAILFQGFGASSLDFEVRVILRNVNFILDVGSEMRHEIARRFAEEGIEIPFPQQDVWLRQAQAAPPQAGQAPTGPVTAPQASPLGQHLTSGDLDADAGGADGSR